MGSPPIAGFAYTPSLFVCTGWRRVPEYQDAKTNFFKAFYLHMWCSCHLYRYDLYVPSTGQAERQLACSAIAGFRCGARFISYFDACKHESGRETCGEGSSKEGHRINSF